MNEKLEGFDIKKIFEAASNAGIKTQPGLESEELKKVWFKYMLESLEKLDYKYSLLELRVKELEAHECKCSGNKGTDIQS